MKNVFCFNADFDLRLGNIYSSKYTRLLDELSLCALILSDKKDIVISNCSHDLNFCNYLNNYGLEIAEKTVKRYSNNIDADSLWMWGFEESAIESLGLAEYDHPDLNNVRKFNSRKFSFEINLQLNQSQDQYRCANIEEVQTALEKLQGYKAVIKPFFGSSAAGFILKNGDTLTDREKVRLPELLKFDDSGFVVEKWHDRIFDFSYGFYLNREGHVEFENINLLSNSEKGMFRSLTILNNFHDAEKYIGKESLEQCRENMTYLAELMSAKGYLGYAGIDGYVYQDEDGSQKIRTLCEINARNTMASYLYYIKKKLSLDCLIKLTVIKRLKEKIETYSDFGEKLHENAYNFETKKGIILLTPLYYFKDSKKIYSNYMYVLSVASDIKSLNDYSDFLKKL